MKVCGIVCEYNPFHKGHAYQIEDTRRQLGEDTCIISVMSGNFVQRGEASICSKFARGEMAVEAGVNLVIELPTVYAMASAEYFAKGAIEILKATGVCDYISFGSECDDLNLLKETAFHVKSDEFINKIKEEMKNGVSFPKARTLALEDKAMKNIIEKPNNILAIEYINALKDSDIKFINVKREGAHHDSEETVGDIASASNIRNFIHFENEYKKFLPETSASILEREIKKGMAPIKTTDFESMILYSLRKMTFDDMKKLEGSQDGLAERLYKATGKANCLEDIYTAIKTKRYTLSRIRRLVMQAFLGITKDDILKKAEYIKVIAFDTKGQKLLKEMKLKSSLPVITKNSAKANFNYPMFASEIVYDNIYSLAFIEQIKPTCGWSIRQEIINKNK